MITTKRKYSIDRLGQRGWIKGNFFRVYTSRYYYSKISKQLNQNNDDNN